MEMVGKLVKRVLKTAWILFVSFFLILLFSLLAIQIPYVQEKLISYAEKDFNKKTGKTFSLEKFDLILPGTITLYDVYVEGPDNDTIVDAARIKVSINPIAFFRDQVDIKRILLDKGFLKIHRFADSTYNYQYIADAYQPQASSTKGSSPAPEIRIGKINVYKSKFIISDETNGQDIRLYATRLNAIIEEFDLEPQRIHISTLTGRNIYGSVYIPPSRNPSDTTESPLDLVVRNFELSNSNINYSDSLTFAGVKFNSLTGGGLSVVLPSQKISAEHLDAGQVSAKYFVFYRSGRASNSMADGPEVKFRNSIIRSSTFSYYDRFSPKAEGTFDYGYFSLSGINGELDHFKMLPNGDIKLKVTGFDAQDRSSGLTISRLESDLSVTSNAVSSINTNGKVSKSNLHGDFSVRNFDGALSKMSLDLQLKKSILVPADIKYFVYMPELDTIPHLKQIRDHAFAVSSSIKGKLSDLDIANLNISVLNKTNLSLKGHLSLNDTTVNSYNITSYSFHSTSGELNQLIYGPDIKELPQWISATGALSGTLEQSTFKTTLQTSDGLLFASGNFNDLNREPTYSGSFSGRGIKLNKLTGNDQLGIANATGVFYGRGFSLPSMDATIKSHIRSIDLYGYNYKGLELTSQVFRDTIKTKVASNDSAFMGEVENLITMGGKDTTIKLVAQIDVLDLLETNLSKDTISLKGTVSTSFTGFSLDELQGDLRLKNFTIVKGQKIFSVDSLLFASVKQDDITTLKLDAPFAEGELVGNTKLTEIISSVENYLIPYVPGKDTISFKEIHPNKWFSFKMKVKNATIINALFLPDVTYEVADIDVAFNHNLRTFKGTIKIPEVKYSSIVVDSIDWSFKSDKSTLTSGFTTGSIVGPDAYIKNTNINFSSTRDTAFLNLLVNNLRGKGLEGHSHITYLADSYLLHMHEYIVLNGKRWTIPSTNVIKIYDSLGFHFKDLDIRYLNQVISLRKPGYASPSVIDFKDFQLEEIAGVFSKDQMLFSGQINGQIEVSSSYAGDLKIKDFGLYGDTLTNVLLSFEPEQEKVKLRSQFRDHVIKGDASGWVSMTGNDELDLDIDLNISDLTRLQEPLKESFSRIGGQVITDLKVKGTATNPSVYGSIKFPFTVFNYKELNSPFTIIDQQLNVDNNSIQFQNFILNDTLFNIASLQGYLCLYSLTDYDYDIIFKSQNFQLLNTNRNGQDLFYGKIIADANLQLKGTPDRPVINGTARLTKGSKINIVTPVITLDDKSERGIVMFKDKDLPDRILLKNYKQTNDSVRIFTPLINANVIIDESTELKLIVNEVTGDSLVVRGNTTFSYSMDESGKTSLTGNYEVTQGTFLFSLANFSRKQFQIIKGSRIIWSGDPLDADVDITAIYTVRAAPIDLFDNPSESGSQEAYLQKLPFDVHLFMKSKLFQPSISFQVQLPPAQQGALDGTVYARLNLLNETESELNQQVFSLLIMNRFFPREASNTTSIVNPNSVARTTMAKFLTQRLNSFSASYMPFINTDFSVNSFADEAGSGGRTDVQMNISKSMFNERFGIAASGVYGLEGAGTDTVTNPLQSLAGDIIAEYFLTPDGRFRLKAIRRTAYMGVLEGQLTQTGGGIVFTRDFKHFSEILRRQDKENFVEVKRK